MGESGPGAGVRGRLAGGPEWSAAGGRVRHGRNELRLTGWAQVAGAGARSHGTLRNQRRGSSGPALGCAWERGSAGSGRAERLGRLGFGSLGWVGLVGFLGLGLGFPSPFFFYFKPNSNLIEFKLYALNQFKICTSMNAQTC